MNCFLVSFANPTFAGIPKKLKCKLRVFFSCLFQVPAWKQIWVPEWIKVGIPGEKWLGKDHDGWEYTSHDLWKKKLVWKSHWKKIWKPAKKQIWVFIEIIKKRHNQIEETNIFSYEILFQKLSVQNKNGTKCVFA